jgi:hypothetical protein
MPTLALVGIPGPRWLPPVPVPLFLVWPLLPVCLGVAWLLERGRRDEGRLLRVVVAAFCQLRGLAINVDATDTKPVRIRFI